MSICLERATELSAASTGGPCSFGSDPKKLLIEEKNSFPLKKELYLLRLALKICLIPSKDSPSYFIWLNNAICINLCLFTAGSLVYVPVSTIITEERGGSALLLVAYLLYCLYTTCTYVYLSLMMRITPNILEMLRRVGSREHDNNFSDDCSKEHPIKYMIIVVLILSVINTLVSVITPEIAMALFGVTDHPVYIWYMHLCALFFSFGWLLSILFVYLGCRVLTSKVRRMIKHIRRHFLLAERNDEDTSIDLIFLMFWHDELFNKKPLAERCCVWVSNIDNVISCGRSHNYSC